MDWRIFIVALVGSAACTTGALPEGGSGYFGSTTPMPETMTVAAEESSAAGGETSDDDDDDGSGEGSAAAQTSADDGAEAPADGVCGDDNLDVGEDCDGMSFGDNSCTSLGFDDGVLACDTECHIITDACFTCGDGEVALAEQCDGNDFGGATCASLGYAQGALSCLDECTTIDTSNCVPLPSCGDGVRNGGEQCDGNDLGAANCVALGFDLGTVSCTAACTLDTTQCMDDLQNCGMMGDLCFFDENDIQSTCCPAGVGGNVLGICNVFVCV